MPLASITYSSTIATSDPNKDGVLVVGRHADLLKLQNGVGAISSKFGEAFDEKHFLMGLDQLSPSSSDNVELHLKNFTLAAMPSTSSRHNAPMHPHILSNLVRSCVSRASNEYVVIVGERDHAFALGCAVARVFPLYNEKAKAQDALTNVTVEFFFYW